MIVGRVDARRAVPWPPLVALALAGALVGPAQLVLHDCLPGAGPLGWLGLRLALLHGSVACPDGTLALGGTGAHSALVVVSVAVPTLLVHLCAVAAGVSVSTLLARAASGIRGVLGAMLHVLPGGARAPWVRAVLVASRDLARAPSRAPTGRHPGRAPPALAAV